MLARAVPIEVVPLQLFCSQGCQILELAHVLGEVAEMAGLQDQTNRVMRAKLGLAESSESPGVVVAGQLPPAASRSVSSRQGSVAEATHERQDHLGSFLSDGGGGPSPKPVAGRGGMAVVALRAENLSEQCAAAAESGRVVHIGARDLASQLRQVGSDHQLLDHRVAAVRAEARAATMEAAEAMARQDEAARETQRVCEQLSSAQEVAYRAQRDAEGLRARTSADTAELKAVVEDVASKLRSMQFGIEEADREHHVSVSRQALNAVATLEERLSRRLSDVRVELESRHDHAAENSQNLARRSREDRVILDTLQTEVRELRGKSSCVCDSATPLSSHAATQEMPSAWHTALNDAVRRAQSFCDAADKKAEEHLRQMEARLNAVAVSFAEERASARTRGEDLQRRFASDLRAEVRSELQRAVAATQFPGSPKIPASNAIGGNSGW